jgi:hypothetical protein
MNDNDNLHFWGFVKYTWRVAKLLFNIHVWIVNFILQSYTCDSIFDDTWYIMFCSRLQNNEFGVGLLLDFYILTLLTFI